jgi:excisionase family DNA binding protein
VGLTVAIRIGDQRLVAELDDDAVAAIAAAVTPTTTTPASPFLTIKEAAEYLRCSRQRVDDLLSARRIERVKDGARTLIRRSHLDAYLANGSR